MFKKNEVLDLTEPRSAIAAVLPLILGILFSVYNYGKLNILGTLFFAITAILMQTAVNTWNNIADFRRNDGKWAQNSVNNSIDGSKGSENRAWFLLFAQLIIIVILGMYLVFTSKVGGWIFALGLFSAAVGYLYSGVNFSLSWTPFGEALSGFTMGFIIFLAEVLININRIDGKIFWSVLLTSIIAITSISNIMLANNISDLKEDTEQGRHTLPYLIGLKNSLRLFSSLYVVGYIAVGFSIYFGFLPIAAALVFLSIIPVFRNVKRFYELQSKRKTFVLSIKNALIITLTLSVGILIGIIFNYLLSN